MSELIPSVPLARASRPRAVFAALTGGWAGRVGLVLILTMAFVAIVGPSLAPYSPTALLGAVFSPPSAQFLLGTDELGRDVLSRVLNGGLTVIVLPTVAVALAFMVGGVLGLASGYSGGLLDGVIARATDVFMSIPPLLLVIVLILTLGSSYPVLILITAFFFAPRIVRIVRAATQSVCQKEYVTAAKVRGENPAAIIVREVLPNITGTLLVELALRLNFAIIFIATLNFLGLGVQPPSSDWGLMVADGRTYLLQAPLLTAAPVFCIAALTIGVNLLADQASVFLARNVSTRA